MIFICLSVLRMSAVLMELRKYVGTRANIQYVVLICASASAHLLTCVQCVAVDACRPGSTDDCVPQH